MESGDDSGPEEEAEMDGAFEHWRSEHTREWKCKERARNVLVTSWEGKWDEKSEPDYRVEGVEMAGGQQERGNLNSKNQRRHRHDAILVVAGESIEAVLKRVFPVTGMHKKDIRIAANGHRFATILKYCTKVTHRWPGTEPMYYRCGPGVAELANTKRKVEEREAEIMACTSRLELSKSKAYRYNPSYVTAVHGNRPLLAAIGGRVRLFGFEVAILELLERPPLPNDASVHWFHPSSDDVEVDTGRIAGILQKAASRKGQSAQIAMHESGCDTSSLVGHLSPRTKVIFVKQFEDSLVPLQRLKWLKTALLFRTSHASQYDLQEVCARHVIVFADTPPKLEGPGCKNVRVWEAEVAQAEWEQKDDLLAYGGVGEGEPFLNLCTAGSSGALKVEVECVE